MIDSEGTDTYTVNSDFRIDYYLLRIMAIASCSLSIIVAARLYGYAWTAAVFFGCTVISTLFTWRLMRKDR